MHASTTYVLFRCKGAKKGALATGLHAGHDATNDLIWSFAPLLTRLTSVEPPVT
jgi:hypothetical protein